MTMAWPNQEAWEDAVEEQYKESRRKGDDES
jgi:hypothetical protein